MDTVPINFTRAPPQKNKTQTEGPQAFDAGNPICVSFLYCSFSYSSF